MQDAAYDLVIKEIKGRLSILNLAENYISLKKSGRGHIGLCPFHDEKTPSFHVNDEKGIFHCFGCGAGGDVFGFIMRYKNISFPEAVEELAKRAGIVIEKKAADTRKPANGALFKINSLASAFYHANLLETEAGGKALAYLGNRGISSDMIREFRLGYAPAAWDGLGKFLASKKAPMPLAERLGLVIKRAGGDGYYDRFRDRIIFPITDVEGKTVGFGGRVLQDGQEPKYLNSPESEIYRKRSELFGLDKSRDHIRRAEMALVVEGYMDFLALYASGIKNVVATLGTSLTQDHASQIRRHADKVRIVFDGDKAGRAASLRVLEIFIEQGLSPNMVRIPEGEDPASLMAAGRREEFERLSNNASPLLDFFIEKAASDLGIGKTTRAKAAETIADVLRKMKDAVERSHYTRKTAEILGVREEDILSLTRNRERKEKMTDLKAPKQPDTTERLMLKILINFPNLSKFLPLNDRLIDAFADDELKPIFEEITLGGVGDLSSLLLKFIGTPTQSMISEIILSSDTVNEEAAAERMLKDCVRKLRRRRLEDALKALRLKIDRAVNEKDGTLEQNLIAQYRDLMERGKALKGETL
ncbi:MAG: DNA primase [Deltaproteobacteria bacterium]